MTMEAQSGLASRGTYELRDSFCEKCEVAMERIEREDEGGKVTFVCQWCGGTVGRLKQRGVLKPKEQNDEPE